MIRRRHAAGGLVSEALYSACGRYRYRLTRRWGEGAPLLFVLLNPSTATEMRNDPTIERCERRARRLGHPGLCVVNLFAFRATAPAALKRAAAPVGPDNDAILAEAAAETAAGGGAVLCGWGAHGRHRGRSAEVGRLLRGLGVPLFHLGLTRDGEPRHPLYVPYAVRPQPWIVPPASKNSSN